MAAKKYLIAVDEATLAAANATTGNILVSASKLSGEANGTAMLVAEITDAVAYKNILGQTVVTVSTVEGMLPAFTIRNIASPGAAMPAPVHSAAAVATTHDTPAVDPLGIVAGDQYLGSSFA